MLKDIRLKKKLSQSELAEAAKINIKTLQKYESGERDINNGSLINIIKLCVALDCNISDVLPDGETKKVCRKYEKKNKYNTKE